jgi:hypothetical protein
MSDFNFNWNGMPSPAVDFAQGIKTTDSIIGERRQAYDTRNAELAQLNAELAQVEAQIAEFDRMNPGIASGDIDIAATMMEAGNYSPYQQAVNAEIGRRQMNASGRDSAESAVRNAIANAKKLEWGLHEADDWMQRKTRGEMKAALDDAKYAAEKNDISLPGEYYDLLAEVEKGAANDTDVGGGDTVLANKQRIERLVRNKNLHDKDIEDLRAKARKMGDNSSEAEKLNALADKYEKSTVEAYVRRNKAIKDAEVDMQNFVNATRNMTDAERMDAFNKAVRNGEKWTSYYTMNGGKLTAKPR